MVGATPKGVARCRLVDVDAGHVWPERGDAMRATPFDISLHVTYNLALDARCCRVKTHPLTADLVAYATAVKEYFERFGTPNLLND